MLRSFHFIQCIIRKACIFRNTYVLTHFPVFVEQIVLIQWTAVQLDNLFIYVHIFVFWA